MRRSLHRRTATVTAGLLLAASVGLPAVAGPGGPDIKEYELPTAVGPIGITTGPDKALWFVGFYGNTVGRITVAGHVTEWAVPTPNSFPDAIVTGADGNLWFTQVLGNSIGRITLDGDITEFPALTPNSRPTVLALGPDGNVWFTQRGRPYPAGASDVATIGRITPDGTVTEFPMPTLGARPLGIAAGPDGNLWFTQSMTDKVARITPDGVVTEYPLPTPCDPRCSPWEITAGPDGAMWFTQLTGNRIGRITTAGDITHFDLPNPASSPNTITAGPGGVLFFTQTAGNRVGVVSTSGRFLEWDVPTPGSGPIGITRGPAGDIWFTQTGSLANPGQRVGRIVAAEGQVTAWLRSTRAP